MKILILDIYYDGFLHDFYLRYPDVATLSYDQNRKKIIDQLFGTSDFYSRNLRKAGVEAEDVILNDKILQKKWAQENGVWYLPFDWSNRILESQILKFKPDVLYCQSLHSPGPAFIKKIRRKIKTFVVGQVASPTNYDLDFLSAYDLILSSLPNLVSRFKEMGVNSDLFRIGFETTVLKSLQELQEKYAVSFVGGFGRHHLQTTKMYENFNYLAKKEHVDFWGYGSKYLPVNSYILKTFHGEPAWGIDMYNILYNSKITLNRHSEVAQDHANNMRLYEATGVGAMLITDYKSDLDTLFVPEKEVETYKTKEELGEKVSYYLTHEKERKKIAQAGQARTLKDHTYEKRMRELVTILQKYL